MPKARLIFRSKLIYPDGAIREMVLWQLPAASSDRSHGLKYRLYYGLEGGTCLVRYDNESGKSDHRHYQGRGMTYRFRSAEQLVADFLSDIARLRKELR